MGIILYDKNKYIIGYVDDNVWYDRNREIKGWIQGDCVTDSYQYGKILYRVHNDGDVTEGTTNNIVCRISDGTITEGTSNRIIGYIDYSFQNGSSTNSKYSANSFSGGYAAGKENPGCGLLVLLIWGIVAFVISIKSEYFGFIDVFIGFPIAFALLYFFATLFG